MNQKIYFYLRKWGRRTRPFLELSTISNKLRVPINLFCLIIVSLIFLDINLIFVIFFRKQMETTGGILKISFFLFLLCLLIWRISLLIKRCWFRWKTSNCHRRFKISGTFVLDQNNLFSLGYDTCRK